MTRTDEENRNPERPASSLRGRTCNSEHSKKVFLETQFEKRNKQTNALEGHVKLEKPIEVLFEHGCK